MNIRHAFFGSGGNDRTINYTYDNLDQLTGVDYSNIPPANAGQTGTNDVQYTYDIWGNRTNLVNPIETVDYTYATNSNELTSLSHNNGAFTANMIYDGNGNLTSEQYTRLGTNTRRTDYGFDAEGRLVGVTYTNQADTATANVLNFAYSDDGNRVGKSVNGVWTYSLNNGLNLLDDISANGTIQKTYIRGLDAIAEITASGTIQFVHTDALGSTILLTDNSGNIAARYEYDAFGNIVGASTQGADTNSLYTGQEFDPESELVYMNARYYNPELGRFVSRDHELGQIGNLVSRNSYVYVYNNPLKYVDPSGDIAIAAPLLLLPEVAILIVQYGYTIVNTAVSAWTALQPAIQASINFIPFVVGYIEQALNPSIDIPEETVVSPIGAITTPANPNDPNENKPKDDRKKNVPQGLTSSKFTEMSQLIRSEAGHISDDIVVQGSRAAGTATAASDIDIGIRVSVQKFEELARDTFTKSRYGVEAEGKLSNALENGIIHSAPARLASLETAIERLIGIDSDVSIIKAGGSFDTPPFIPIR